MDFEPSHSQEPELHEELRKALNAALSSTDFFVWIGVDPTGEADHFSNLLAIVEATELWLSRLDPDALSDAQSLPRKRFSDPAADVEIQAIPKKESARGNRPGEIVGNPAPILTAYGS
jgi:hypothetical protein